MKIPTRPVRAGFALLAVVLALAGCGDGRTDIADGGSFATPITGTDGVVGVVVNPGDRRVPAYLCDGQALAIWFSGQADADGAVTLSSPDGARLVGRVRGDGLKATITLPDGGAAHDLGAPAVKAPAGLHRARGEVDGQPTVGGWVVLADGRQRGAVRTSTGFIDSESNSARPGKPVTSFTSTDVDL